MKRAIADWLRALAMRLDPALPSSRVSLLPESEPRECADHPGHYPCSGCPATECRFPHCLVDRRRAQPLRKVMPIARKAALRSVLH